MIIAEVQRAASILNDELKKVKRTVSRKAILEEAWMIVFVLCGIRCAGLLSKLQTDNENISALMNALSLILNNDVENVLILVHVPSQQTFIVNRKLLFTRLNRTTNHAFLAIDHAEVNAKVHGNMPSSLKKMLEEIEMVLGEEGRLSVQIISLTCEHSLQSSNSAKTGVALAGWLLEYPLVYYFSQSENFQLRASIHSASSIVKLLSNCSDDWEEADDMQMNNLAGKDLNAFCVDLLIRSESEIVQNILQFTIPVSAIHPTAEAIGMRNGSLEDIRQNLTKHFDDRIQIQKGNQMSIRVDTKQIRMDRVAI
ncbi:hypothetical protein L7F22_038953 [Adiantum nelumboides]|nr:hypothetical protein [Adiantum nelumboides]